jgi:cell division septal protein FtsQ
MKPRKRRASRFPRPSFSWRHKPPAARLAGLVWSQSNAVTEKEEGRAGRRGLAAVLALAELGLATFLISGPLFQVRHVDVRGAARLGPAQVRSIAGLNRPVSVFSVDAATIRRKLTATAWVREATVSTELPDRVVVAVEEWQPVAAYRAGPQGRPLYLSDRGIVLGPAADRSAVLDIQGPAGAEPRVGQTPLELPLLTALVNIQRQLPSMIGQSVTGFQVDGCGNLTMVAGKGWRALFGRVITPEEIAALNDKLAALKSIAADVNFNSPDLDYINLMNPSEPAVKLKSARPPATPTPSPGASAKPSPSPSIVVQPVISCA